MSQPQNPPQRIRVLLYPDGRLTADRALIPAETPWQALGQVVQSGESLTFVRVDVARISWTALVPTRALSETDGPVVVTLAPRLPECHEPLTGWPLFS